MLIFSHSAIGYEGDLVSVEVHLRRGIPGMDIVGLPGSAVKEARDRVRTAIKSIELNFPSQRILINLAPADIRKVGSLFDLPMAVGILYASSQLPALEVPLMLLGELSLNGDLRWVPGVLPALHLGVQKGIQHFVVPWDNREEATVFPDAHVLAARNLQEVYQTLHAFPAGFSVSPAFLQDPFIADDEPYELNFNSLKGQGYTKRALEIAAAGRHHTILAGPPGAGKTLAARCFASILPWMSFQEALEVTQVWSLAGKLPKGKGLLRRRPFQGPHHSASLEGLVGGGYILMPGEASLAHRGILFLDEVLEFKKRILQGLREPLEDKGISLVRAGRSYFFPTDFQLLLTANLCPCGNMGKEETFCGCSSIEIQNYWKRLGGALLDRIDIRVKVTSTPVTTLLDEQEEDAFDVRQRVNACYTIQQERYAREKGLVSNGTLNAEQVDRFCRLTQDLKDLLNNVLVKWNFSSRAVHSLLKVARTIADLREQRNIDKDALLEAVHHRRYLEDMDDL